jgi:hypothetical protein
LRFFSAAGKSDVDSATEHFLADAEMTGGIAHELHELRRGNLRFAARLALGVERGAQERSSWRHQALPPDIGTQEKYP